MRNVWFFVLLSVFVSGCSISDGSTRLPRPQIVPFLTVVLPSAIPQSADNHWLENTSPVVSAPAGTELFAVVGVPRGALYASIQWFGPDGQNLQDAVVFHSNSGLAPQISSEPFTLEVDTTVVYTVNGHDSRPIGDSPYSLAVSVEEGPDSEPKVTDIQVNPKSKAVNVHEYFGISWTLQCGDEACSNQEVLFSSSDPSVAMVDEFGTVVGQGSGETTITVRADQDTSVYANVSVAVASSTDPEPDPDLEVTEVWVNPKSKAVNVHEYFGISWTVYCGRDVCDNQDVVFTSSDPSVAMVDEFGTVVAQSVGKVSIFVKSAKDTSVYANVSVTVRDPDPDPDPEVTEVWVNPKSKTINRFDYFAVSWIVYCGLEACEDQTVSLSSRDTSVATIDGFGTVVGQGRGTTFIVVRSRKDTSVYANVSVTVR